MKIFICEDDPKQRENMVTIIKNYIMIEEKPMEIALATDNPYEVLEQAKNMNDIGCYFLDIQLSTDINGIKLGSEIRKHDPVGNIIFVTSHSELTYLTFVYKVAAMDFIFKDDPAELRTRIIDCLETAHTRLQLLSKDNSVETIELKRGSNSVYVQYDDIMFFESSTKSHRLIAHKLTKANAVFASFVRYTFDTSTPILEIVSTMLSPNASLPNCVIICACCPNF